MPAGCGQLQAMQETDLASMALHDCMLASFPGLPTISKTGQWEGLVMRLHESRVLKMYCIFSYLAPG